MNYFYYATIQELNREGMNPDFIGTIAEPVRIPEDRNILGLVGNCVVIQPCKTAREVIALANTWNNDFANNGRLPNAYRRYDGKAIQYTTCINLGA